MKLYIKNKIDLEGHLDVIEQSYPLKLKTKNGKLYLTYANDQKETVVLKCDKQEMIMTRFSNPVSTMRFCSAFSTIANVVTVAGVQQLQIETLQYHLDYDRHSMTVRYNLKSIDGESIFAKYHLEIRWE